MSQLYEHKNDASYLNLLSNEECVLFNLYRAFPVVFGGRLVVGELTLWRGIESDREIRLANVRRRKGKRGQDKSRDEGRGKNVIGKGERER